MHVNLGGYHVRDIEFTLGIDINVTKVEEDLSDAIFAAPNNTYKFCEVPELHVPVVRGMTHDGLGKYLSQVIVKAPGPTADIASLLKETKTDVVVNFLPVGSEEATKWYVEQVLQAGCAFVNGIPVFIASQDYWAKRFREAKLPLLGDDIKSQVGATILHRVLTTLFVDRGVRIDRTYQLNFGGNTDFLNMLERERLESKKISKTGAVTSMIPYDLGSDNIHVGPSDHVPWLTDRKWCYIRMEGTTFGEVPLNLEAKLEVWDSPNSAGVMIDAIRCAKLAMDRGLSGPIVGTFLLFLQDSTQSNSAMKCAATWWRPSSRASRTNKLVGRSSAHTAPARFHEPAGRRASAVLRRSCSMTPRTLLVDCSPVVRRWSFPAAPPAVRLPTTAPQLTAGRGHGPGLHPRNASRLVADAHGDPGCHGHSRANASGFAGTLCVRTTSIRWIHHTPIVQDTCQYLKDRWTAGNSAARNHRDGGDVPRDREGGGARHGCRRTSAQATSSRS